MIEEPMMFDVAPRMEDSTRERPRPAPGPTPDRPPAEVAETRPGRIDPAPLRAGRAVPFRHAGSPRYRRSAFGTARLSDSVSKYASWPKLKKEAMKLVGVDWIAFLYAITESLWN